MRNKREYTPGLRPNLPPAPITDEIYESMAPGDQLLVAVAEALNIEFTAVQYSDTGNWRVSHDTIEALHEKLFDL